MMSNDTTSRRQILDRLRAAPAPFPGVETPATLRPVVPRGSTGRAALVARFVEEAEKLACQVSRTRNEKEALATVLSLLVGETAISCWAPEEIPLPGLIAALEEAGVRRAPPADATVRVGLSGAQAALAATGSLILTSGPGRDRATSLLPPVHVVVLREAQIMADLEQWMEVQREDGFKEMRGASNIVIVSGPSRTADIAMELVMGMHGPKELQIVLLP
jgi:L-lactate dehydrogenase complex protein LldG